jgi:hypothetical protein
MGRVLSANQRKLLRFASFAHKISWGILFVNTLFVIMQFVNVKNAFAYRHYSDNITIIEMFKEDALYTITFLVDMLNQMLRGVFYWILFQSASLGLRMIVETNINSRAEEVGDE